jgi:thiol-disulfide isomerase/thioredoxin
MRACLLLLLLQPLALHGFSPDVKKSKDELLHDRLLHDLAPQNSLSTPLFIKFHAPWCGFCKKLVPVWEELEQEFPAMLRSVDCTAEFAKPFCEEHDVNGYPTLILFKKGVRQQEYDGERDSAALSSYLREAVEDVDPLAQPGGDAAVFIGFFAPWCGHCQELKPKWEALKKTYENHLQYRLQRVHIANIDCKLHAQYCSVKGITGYPTINLYLPHQQTAIEYLGPKEEASLVDFLETHLGGDSDAEL